MREEVFEPRHSRRAWRRDSARCSSLPFGARPVTALFRNKPEKMLAKPVGSLRLGHTCLPTPYARLLECNNVAMTLTAMLFLWGASHDGRPGKGPPRNSSKLVWSVERAIQLVEGFAQLQ